MNVIEIAGKLKKTVFSLNDKYYSYKHAHLDKDFLLDLSNYIVAIFKNKENKVNYNKIFLEEIIQKTCFDIQINELSYNLALTRKTFGDKIIIGCKIESTNKDELFGCVYNIKVRIIEIFNQVCENSDVYLLEDFNNEMICESAYLEIYKLENRLRNLFTQHLIKEYGQLVFSAPLRKEVDEYSKWFKKETTGYPTFKRINTDYANLDFANIIKLLDLNDAKHIDDSNTSIIADIDNLNTELDDDINYAYIRIQIKKIKNKLGKRKKLFAEVREPCEIFGFTYVDQSDYIDDILDKDFRDTWENKLSKMRNMVAHNKPICKELYEDIIKCCKEASKKINKCFELIEASFTHEDGVLSALEDEAIEEEEFAIEEEDLRRELGGLSSLDSFQYKMEKEFLESKDYYMIADLFDKTQSILTELEETHSMYKNHITLLSKISNKKLLINKFNSLLSKNHINTQVNQVNEINQWIKEQMSSIFFEGFNYPDSLEVGKETVVPKANHENMIIAWDNTVLSPSSRGVDTVYCSISYKAIRIATGTIQIDYGYVLENDDGNISEGYPEQVEVNFSEIANVIHDVLNEFIELRDIHNKYISYIITLLD